MKTLRILLLATALGGIGLLLHKAFAADSIEGALQPAEYVTIRWSGRENTHLIRSNGKVEFLGPILTRVQRPDRVDDRSFYMNIAMNAVAKEGYEFAGMTPDEIVMRRSLSQRDSRP